MRCFWMVGLDACRTMEAADLTAWTSLALPALQAVLPRLRDGSLVFVDKTSRGAILWVLIEARGVVPWAALNCHRYHGLLDFVGAPENRFTSMTIPFSEGFEVVVYRPMLSLEG